MARQIKHTTAAGPEVEMVNFDKCWKVANVIREVQQYQQARDRDGKRSLQ